MEIDRCLYEVHLSIALCLTEIEFNVTICVIRQVLIRDDTQIHCHCDKCVLLTYSR